MLWRGCHQYCGGCSLLKRISSGLSGIPPVHWRVLSTLEGNRKHFGYCLEFFHVFFQTLLIMNHEPLISCLVNVILLDEDEEMNEEFKDSPSLNHKVT